MASRWTLETEEVYRKELQNLYTAKNLSIAEIGKFLGIAESTVFRRLKRLGIKTSPKEKKGYLDLLKKIHIPSTRTDTLAEFFGIMLGDGHISKYQTVVTLGTKELAYVDYVAELMDSLFHTSPSTIVRADGYRDVYIGSVELTTWLQGSGLVPNKVASQVSAPEWLFKQNSFLEAFLRGFFDTDGSVYALRYGVQISLTNHSVPLLHSLRSMLIALEYRPSRVSGYRVYLTRKKDVSRFFAEVRPANTKHLTRFNKFKRRWRSGKRTRL